jgi:hypothetical protein
MHHINMSARHVGCFNPQASLRHAVTADMLQEYKHCWCGVVVSPIGQQQWLLCPAHYMQKPLIMAPTCKAHETAANEHAQHVLSP